MMKRAMFWLLALSVTCSAACQPAGTKNTPGNYNQKTTDTNQPVNGNTNSNTDPTLAARDKDDKAVAIIVRPTADDGVEILLSQDKIKLKREKRKLRFVVINNLEVDIGKVEVVFKNGKDPFDGTPPFKTGLVKAGDDKATQQRKAIGEIGTYPYTVNVYAADGTTLLKSLDPQVEIVALTGIEF